MPSPPSSRQPSPGVHHHQDDADAGDQVQPPPPPPASSARRSRTPAAVAQPPAHACTCPPLHDIACIALVVVLVIGGAVGLCVGMTAISRHSVVRVVPCPAAARYNITVQATLWDGAEELARHPFCTAPPAHAPVFTAVVRRALRAGGISGTFVYWEAWGKYGVCVRVPDAPVHEWVIRAKLEEPGREPPFACLP